MTAISPELVDKLIENDMLGKIEQLPNEKVGFIIPQNMKLVQVGPHDPILPVNIQQAVTIHDEHSFIRYVDTYKSEKTALFSAPGFLANGRPFFQGRMDYHEQDEVQRDQHVVTYRPRYSDEWKLWNSKTGGMDQEEFAEFIEENRQNVIDPEAARLLDMARNFKASRTIHYDKAFTEKDGSVKLTYDDETEAKGEISVPDQLKIGIPVYFNSQRVEMELWVRYRVISRTVKFFLKPDRADVVEQFAFDQMVERIVEATGVPHYLGWPEEANVKSAE